MGAVAATRGAKGLNGLDFASVAGLLEITGALAVGKFASVVTPNISDPEILLVPLDDGAFVGSTRKGFGSSAHFVVMAIVVRNPSYG